MFCAQIALSQTSHLHCRIIERIIYAGPPTRSHRKSSSACSFNGCKNTFGLILAVRVRIDI